MKHFLVLILLMNSLIGFSQQEITNYKNNAMKKGIYKTYCDFILNTPTLIDSFYIDSVPHMSDSWKGTYSVIPREKKYGKILDNIWGFCDGNRNYIYFRKEFFTIKTLSNQLLFYSYSIPDNSNSFTSYLVGGLIGYAFYNSEANEKSKNEIQRFFIDPISGKVVLSKEYLEYYKTENRYAQLILYRLDKDEKKENVAINISNIGTYAILPNSYIKFDIPIRQNPIDILYNNYEKSFVTCLDLDNPVYIRCYNLKNNTGASFEIMESSKGEIQSNSAKHKQYKLEKRNDRESQ